MLRVTITGSECTGKTTLAAALSRHYGVPWSREYAREFVAESGVAPGRQDVATIARGQIRGEDVAQAAAGDLVLLDTDLLSTVVYSSHYYGGCPAWIEAELKARKADLYLLAGIDVPWRPAGAQRDRGDRREEMHALFRDALVRRALPFAEINGPHERRLRDAISAVDALLASGSGGRLFGLPTTSDDGGRTG